MMSTLRPHSPASATSSINPTNSPLPPFSSISPPNHSTYVHSPIHATVHTDNNHNSCMPSLTRFLPRSCHLLSCTNFAKIHGYCADHFHSNEVSTPSAAPLLPPLRIENPMVHHTQPRHDFYSSTPTTTTSSGLYLPSLSMSLPSPARRFSDPLTHAMSPVTPLLTQLHLLRPPSSCSFKRSLPLRRQSIDSSSYDAIHNAQLQLSPTNSTASTSSTSASTVASTAGAATKPQTRCRRGDCPNAARRKGLCMEHGGRHFCKMDGCNKCAHRGGFCIAHGGGRRCAIAQCTKSAQSGGVCYSHGGGKRCSTEGCTHAARSGGSCIKHGKMLKSQEDTSANASQSEDE